MGRNNRNNNKGQDEVIEICSHNGNKICNKCKSGGSKTKMGSPDDSQGSPNQMSQCEMQCILRYANRDNYKTTQSKIPIGAMLRLKIQKSASSSKNSKISKISKSASCKKTLSLSKLKLSSSNRKKYNRGHKISFDADQQQLIYNQSVTNKNKFMFSFNIATSKSSQNNTTQTKFDF